jgi:hypothetical protein
LVGKNKEREMLIFVNVKNWSSWVSFVVDKATLATAVDAIASLFQSASGEERISETRDELNVVKAKRTLIGLKKNSSTP